MTLANHFHNLINFGERPNKLVLAGSMFVLNIQFNLMFIVLIAYYQLSPFDHYIVV